MAEEFSHEEPYNFKTPAFNKVGLSGIYKKKIIAEEFQKIPLSPGLIHAAIVNGYRMRQLALNYAFITKNKMPWGFISARQTDKIRIPVEETKQLEDGEVTAFLDSLGATYISEGPIRTRFTNGLKREIERNDIFRALFKRLAGIRAIQNEAFLSIPLPTLLSNIGNPLFYRFLGNAIVRAQMADQYNADYRKTESQRQESGFNEDDPFAVGLDKAVFKEGIMVISSMGSPRSINKKEVRILDEGTERDIVEQFLDNKEVISEVLSDSLKPNLRGQYLEAKGGKKIPLTVGSYALMKKLWHSFESKVPYRTNFPFELLTKALNLKSLDQLRKGRISSLKPEECEALQLALQELAGQLIPDIIQNAQTIVIKGEEICMVNHLGQGIRLKLEYLSGFSEVRFQLRGFFDSMSILER